MEEACPITCCAGFVVLDSTSKLSNFATSEVDGIRHEPWPRCRGNEYYSSRAGAVLLGSIVYPDY